MTKQTKSIAAVILGTAAIFGTVYIINPGGDSGVFKPDCSQYKAGDTLKLEEGKSFTYVYLDGLKGDSANPIVVDGRFAAHVDNYDAKNWFGVKLLLGKVGAPGKVCISVHGFANHIEITGGEVSNCEYGFWVKNEPRTFEDSIYSHTVLNDIYIHDVYAHDIAQHFLYAGATEYPNVSRPAVINGVTYYFNPSLLSNIRINNNKIRRMGKNGPMLCLATSGFNEIAHNDIDTVGTGQYADQGTGIAAGGFSNVWIHDNVVKHSWQPNIWSFGSDSVRIENNICSDAGNTGTATQAWPENIRIQIDPHFTKPVKFTIDNNQTSGPGKIGVYKLLGTYSNQNEICGNTGTLNIEAGVTYSTTCVSPPAPQPQKTIFKKGYWTINNKRFYYTCYSDSTWSNKK